MRDDKGADWPDPHRQDILAGDRRLSRPDASLPDWEVPDVAYRPVPIVWFTAAMIAQQMALALVMAVIPAGRDRIAIALAALVSASIGKWTWDRGMGSAGRGWRAAMLAVLIGQFALIALALAPAD